MPRTGGASLPSTHSRSLGLVAVMALLITAALSFVAPAAQAADEVSITNGTVTWGVKQSWRNYIGDSAITISGGVTRTNDGAFKWPVESGSYNPDSKRLDLVLGGSVHFTGHDGALDMTISKPRLVVSGDEPQLLATVVSKSESTGQQIEYGEIPMVNLDLESGNPSTTDGSTTWTPLDARLTAEAYEAFSHNYGVNTLVDPVSLNYVGPGGKPAITAENWLSPGSLVYEQSGSHPITGATAVLPDQDNGVVHVATGTTLRAYDYTTMQPLGDAIPFVGDTYPAPVLHDYSGAIFANNGGKAKAYMWNAETKVYDVQELNATTMTQFAAGTSTTQMWGFNSTGVYRWVYQAASKTYTKTEYPVTGLPNGRVGFAAATASSMVFAEAGVKPFSLSIVGGVATRTDLPGEYADPNGQPGFNYPTEVQIINSAEYVLSNYRGQIMRIQGLGGGFARIGSIIETGMNGVLRSTIDRSTGTVYLADYAGQTVVAVQDGAYGLITVKDLGVWVLATLPVGGNDGVLFVGASRTDGSGTDNGIRRYSFLGNSPTVNTQPQNATVTLQTGQANGAASFSVDGTLIDSIQWQTRAGSTGRFTDIAGATDKKLDVTATATDEGRQYRAAARNALGAMVSNTAVLTVHTAPAVIIQPTAKAVTDGDDALFEMMPSGNPYPSITWQRRVGGFWEDIKSTDVNYRIDGGKLTVRSTNVDQDGTLFRAQLSNVVDTTFSKSSTLTVAARSETVRVIEAGQLNWGVKKSFRDYVVGNIAHGEITVSGGATKNPDGTFAFAVESGTWDPKSKKAAVDYAGTVQFTGHAGALNLKISNPALKATGNTGVLSAEVVGKDMTSGQTTDYGRVALADVDTTDAVSAAGTTVEIKNADTVLTTVGAPAFAGFYAEGTALDALDSQLTLGKEIGVGVPSRTEVKAAKSSYTYGASTTASVTVTAAGASPGGTVKVTVAGKKITGTLTGGKATVALPKGLTPGSYPVIASFSGSDGIAGSVSATNVKVAKATPKISTKLSKSTIKKSQRAKLRITATLPSATAGLHPTGQLVIRDGGKIIAIKTLKPTAKGKVTVTLPQLAKGKHFIKVTLTGNSLQTTKSTGYRNLQVR